MSQLLPSYIENLLVLDVILSVLNKLWKSTLNEVKVDLLNKRSVI